MIKEVEFYHGAALARLCRADGTQDLSIRAHHVGRSAYLINGRVGVYIKYSSKRMSPWQFSFSGEHQREIAGMMKQCSAVFVTLVCGTDGVACLSQEELRRVLDEDFRAMEWIKAARKPREKYSITGSDGGRIFKVGDNEFPAKVLAACS